MSRLMEVDAVVAACSEQARRPTPGIDDMAAYLERQVDDVEHREVIGPLLDGSGASGVVLHHGETVATWGDPSVPEMAFSATKSIVALVAGVAFDQGLLHPGDRVADTVGPDRLSGIDLGTITWEHLLQQTSSWDGVLWGKPARVDAQSFREGDEVHDVAPGEGWAYNDVRINLLTLALTALLGRSLQDVLRDHVLGPLGAGTQWSWHGYDSSYLELDDLLVPVVSGGAHWGGGLSISATDLARVGQLHLDRGRCDGVQLLSEQWMDAVWAPCPVKPEYGYLWWRNDTGKVWPRAPRTGRCARGNGGRHLLWVDPARDLVIVSRWGEDVEDLLVRVSAAVTARPRPASPP